MANWGSNAVVSQVFPLLMGAIGPGGTFTIICGLLLGSVLFIYFFVVETKNTSLEALDVMFRRRAGLPVNTYTSNDFDLQGNHLNHDDMAGIVSLSASDDKHKQTNRSAAE